MSNYFVSYLSLGLAILYLITGSITVKFMLCPLFFFYAYHYYATEKDGRDFVYRFWDIVHNLIAHPLLLTNTKWSDRFHDWTAEKMK